MLIVVICLFVCEKGNKQVKQQERDVGCVFVLELYIRFLQFVGYWKITMGFVDRARVTMMVYLGQDTVHHVIMAYCSDSGVQAASDFVLSGHFLSTQQKLAVRVELFVQNLKSVFYQVEEFIISQISEIVYGIANGRYSRVILKGVDVFFPQSFEDATLPSKNRFLLGLHEVVVQ
ncbi:Hypothetical_protein [Hexamita inflata]|uniref:Hypothetical_protein n=1 Tax=Hexamita inflata TaxID=28002 RepID=A0ABP1HGR1_9EUKA